MENSQDGALGTLTSLIQHFGLAYYPYGTLIDLAHDNAEDSRRWQSKEFDSDINKYYFGARFYDPLFGLWLTPDPAGQFANPYTYGGDPLNYIDPNGESITAAIAIGAAVGAAIGASVSAVNCSGASEVSCGRAVAQGTLKGAAVGAISGAISGGVAAVASSISGTTSVAAEGGAMIASAGAETANAASYSYAIFNNMFWSTVESSLQYAATGWMNDGGYSWSGFGGAALGGLLGGAIPGYQPVLGEGIVKNVLAETAYSGVRSAALGYLGGGLGSLMRNGAWNNDAAVQGALLGGLSGSVGALVKIVAFGYAVPKSGEQQKKEADYAKEHNLIIGPYGSVRRSGGLTGVLNKFFNSTSDGVTIGRNAVSWGDDDKTSIHEGIHYLQQVRYGTLSFYINTADDYLSYRGGIIYGMKGSMEYEANEWAGLHSNQDVMDHPGYR